MDNFYDQFCSFENLYLVYRKARKGKRGHPPAAGFELNQEQELLRLRDELQAGVWQPGKYHNFYIHEPKRRLISAAPFRDRVVHHALCNLIEPDWERRFIYDTYAGFDLGAFVGGLFDSQASAQVGASAEGGLGLGLGFGE